MTKQSRQLKKWHRELDKKEEWIAEVRGAPGVFTRAGIFHYKDTVIAGGMIENHPEEQIFLQLLRYGEEDQDVNLCLERDEGMAIITVLAAALYVEEGKRKDVE